MSTLKKFSIRKIIQKKANNITFGLLLIAGALAVLCLLFIISLCVGTVSFSPFELIKLIFSSKTSTSSQIIQLVRLPRTIAAVLAGISFAMAGSILQGVLHNPLCSPNIIGVNAGAGLFMIVAAAFFPTAVAFFPIAAFTGALVAVLLVYLFSVKSGGSRLAVVLAGVAVSGLLSALTDTVITLVPDAKIARVDFMIGSFNGISMQQVIFALPYIAVGTITALLLSHDMNVLLLGDSAAAGLGMRVGRIRGILLITAALLAGSGISLAGLVGFVGLIVPHITRLIAGQDNRVNLPLSGLLGGCLCLFCDILARTLFTPYEIPVGILLSLLGTPFFLWLILKRKRRSGNA